MINNTRFKIIAGKVNKITEFYTMFARNMPDCIIRQRDQASRPGRGQMFETEAESEAKASRLSTRPNL